MASGMKKMVINTQERAISPDINRLQDFKAKDIAELWRYLADVTENFDLTPGVITEFSALGTPMRAEVINGLMVEPSVGSLTLDIKPGLLFAIAPDAGLDDSNYKFVSSVGLPVAGGISMTANPGVSTRIDVIECSIADTITETDNRDIFNPSTGLFVAASKTKARAGTLVFRVRAGTPGAGFPGSVSGWLPLMVARVPAATVSNDTMTFWDVRPLVSDRVRGLSAGEHEVPVWGDMNFRVQSGGSGATPSNLEGYCRVGYRGRWLGGTLRRGTKGPSDTGSVDLRNVDVQEGAGITSVVGAPYYIYLLIPFGLPRWSRYTEFGVGFRRPRSPNGIMVVSVVPPDARSRPSTAITLPTGLGFSSTTTDGVCISSSFQYLNGFGGFYTHNRKTLLTDTLATITNTVVPSLSLIFRAYVVPITHFPPNATAIYAKSRIVLQSPNTAPLYIDFLQMNPGMFIREQSVANPGTGFASPNFTPAFGWLTRVHADDVYFSAVSTGCDAWLPIGGAIWPLLNAHPVIGYDLQMGSYSERQQTPPNPIDISGVVYVNGWEF